MSLSAANMPDLDGLYIRFFANNSKQLKLV